MFRYHEKKKKNVTFFTFKVIPQKTKFYMKQIITQCNTYFQFTFRVPQIQNEPCIVTTQGW